MSEDEIQKKMEFIIEQQAQFAADIQLLRETQEADMKLLKEKHGSLTDAVITVVGVIGQLSAAQERTNAHVAELAESVSSLADAQANTDERLNTLIGVIERYFSNGRNGKE